MTPTANKEPCRFCLNAYSDPEGELTPDNDLSYSTIGFSVKGHRLMLGCGNHEPLRIVASDWKQYPAKSKSYDGISGGWTDVAIYYPKFCPECGRKLEEFEIVNINGRGSSYKRRVD